MSEACPVCGAEVDEYGCLGRFTDRHDSAALGQLKNCLRTLLGRWADYAEKLGPNGAETIEDVDDFRQGQAVAFWTCIVELRFEVDR